MHRPSCLSTTCLLLLLKLLQGVCGKISSNRTSLHQVFMLSALYSMTSISACSSHHKQQQPFMVEKLAEHETL
jgi:hypothetical protein